jgi:2-enoate reductase
MLPADRTVGEGGVADSEGLVAELLDWFDTWPKRGAAQAAGWTMDARLHPYDRLFSPLTVNRLVLPNRIAMGPMGNLSMPIPPGDRARR